MRPASQTWVRSFGPKPTVPTKKSVHIEIVAFAGPRRVAFSSHSDSTFFSPRLLPSPRRSASRDSCSPASALGPAAFEPSSQAPPLLGWLSRLWNDWRSALLLVKPETVI